MYVHLTNQIISLVQELQCSLVHPLSGGSNCIFSQVNCRSLAHNVSLNLDIFTLVHFGSSSWVPSYQFLYFYGLENIQNIGCDIFIFRLSWEVAPLWGAGLISRYWYDAASNSNELRFMGYRQVLPNLNLFNIQLYLQFFY
jgi:hypothetical protein